MRWISTCLVLAFVALEPNNQKVARAILRLQDVNKQSEGSRYRSLISVYAGVPLESFMYSCFGASLSTTIIVTTCSCIARWTYKETMEVFPATNILVIPLELEFYFTKKELAFVPSTLHSAGFAEGVEIHNRCDKQYTVDVGLINVRADVGFKPVWLHTAEAILFKYNLDKVSAANTHSGGCKVYVFQHEIVPFYHRRVWVWEEKKVTIRSWWECIPLMYNSKKIEGKYCVSWDDERPLCRNTFALPVFCDIEEVEGIVGLILPHTRGSQNFHCSEWHSNHAIMQGLSPAIDYIRDLSLIALSAKYVQEIPAAFKALRVPYVHSDLEKVIDEENLLPFKYYFGAKYLSVVNIYLRTISGNYVNACSGTAVQTTVVFTAHSCLTMVFGQEYNSSFLMDLKLIRLLDDHVKVGEERTDAPFQYLDARVKKVHSKFVSFEFLLDYAAIELEDPLKSIKLAWIPTYTPDNFEIRMQLLVIADLVRGFCHYPEPKTKADAPPTMRGLRFVQWIECMDVICPHAPSMPTNPFGKPDIQECLREETERICVESSEQLPLCDLPSGTPVFCDVHVARGFVGYLSHAWTNQTCKPHDKYYAVMYPLTRPLRLYQSLITVRSDSTIYIPH